MRVPHLLVPLLLLALTGCPVVFPDPPVCGPTGLPTLDGDLLDPWPNAHLQAPDNDGTCHLSIPADAVPVGDSQPMDVARFDFRDGFSPAGTMVWRGADVVVDPSALPPLDDPGACLQDESPVQVWDLDAGTRLPCFAELDAWPEQEDHARALLIRPMVHMGFERRIGVAITSTLVDESGATVPSPGAFAAIRDGEVPVDVADDVVGHYADLLSRLDTIGVDRASLVYAWDFRTSSRASIVAPLDHVVAAMRRDLLLLPDAPVNVVVSDFRDADAGDIVPAGLWREVRGSVELPQFLWEETGADDATDSEHDRGIFRLDPETGLPTERGPGQVFFTLVIPETVRSVDPGSVPVVVFGHGLFSSPQAYIASPTDENSTIELCSNMNAICVGTEWRGLTTRDVADSVRVATDIGRFPLLTDKLVQGVANQLAMARLFRTTFVQQEFLLDGGVSLPDPDQVGYFGISLGGIEGAVFLANSEVVDNGVLHVPGAVWATMLERSSNWTDFESFVVDTQPDAGSRQVIYALSQLLWDPVDPINHAEALAGKSGLWQLSIGDEQVPNFTVDILARTMGLPLVGEPITTPWGLEVLSAPQGPGASGMTQFDSGLARPTSANRPAEVTGAHKAIRHTPEMMSQAALFLEGGSEGTIIDPCGGPCVFDPDE